MDNKLRSKYWAGDLAEVAEYCGDKAAQALLDNFAGIDIYVPRVLHNSSKLSKIDLLIAHDICTYFAGSALYIPKTLDEDINALRAEAKALKAKKLTNAEIAQKMGRCTRHISRYLNDQVSPKVRIPKLKLALEDKTPDDPSSDQMDLFRKIS